MTDSYILIEKCEGKNKLLGTFSSIKEIRNFLPKEAEAHDLEPVYNNRIEFIINSVRYVIYKTSHNPTPQPKIFKVTRMIIDQGLARVDSIMNFSTLQKAQKHIADCYYQDLIPQDCYFIIK